MYMDYDSAIKGNGTGPSVEMWTDVETITQVSQKKKTEYSVLTYMWSLGKWHRLSYLQSRKREMDLENKPMVTKKAKGEELG